MLARTGSGRRCECRRRCVSHPPKGAMMVEYLRTVQLGAVTVTVINVGDIQVPYDEWLNVSPEERSVYDMMKLTEPVRMPIQCFHVALPGASILVDASAYDFPPDHP